MANKEYILIKDAEEIIKKAVDVSIRATIKWIESDEVFIVDKTTKQRIENCEISSGSDITLNEGYVYPALKEIGIEFI